MVASGMVMRGANTSGCRRRIRSSGRGKISRNRERDREEQKQLARMRWHCITVWECELKGERREKTLESQEYTLNHIFIQDRDLRYRLPEREDLGMAAEENVLLF